MRAVVIGGSGFVGRRVTEMIAAERRDDHPRFESVHVVDRAPYRGTSEVTSEIGDVCSKDDLRRALRGAHTVFHLASIVDVGLARNPRIDAVNVQGTRNVVEVCRELGVPYLVYTSSEDVVLGRTPVAAGDESIPYPTDPIHDYVRTKIEGERIALAADGTGGLRTCSIRPVHVYGPGDPHAIPTSLRELASGRVPVLIGDASARFDVVYVDNVAHAHLLAAARLHDAATRERVAGKAFFVGEEHAPGYFEWLRPYAESRGVAIPRRRLPRAVAFAVARAFELAHRVTGREPPFHRFHLYVMGQDFFFSDARARRELGYRPIVDRDEARRRTLAWVKDLPLG